MPSRITTEVQARKFSRSSNGRLSKTEIAEFELSRRTMLTDPASGGLSPSGETSPAYLASAGNDYGFASGIDIAIMGTLKGAVRGMPRGGCRRSVHL